MLLTGILELSWESEVPREFVVVQILRPSSKTPMGTSFSGGSDMRVMGTRLASRQGRCSTPASTHPCNSVRINFF